MNTIPTEFKADSGIITAIETGKTELWLSSGQKRWRAGVSGREVLADLADYNFLAGCVDLADLEAIQAKGIEFFRKNFPGENIFGWRGVRDGFVPYLTIRNRYVQLFWSLLSTSIGVSAPALRRK